MGRSTAVIRFVHAASLRQKVWLAVITSILLLLGLFLSVSDTLYVKRVDRMELAQAREEGARVQRLLRKEIADLAKSARDYAEWDDTVRFIAGQASGYRESNWTYASLSNIEVDLVGLFGADGQPFQGVARAPETGECRALEVGDFAPFRAAARAVVNDAAASRRESGVVLIGPRVLLFACVPVRPGERTGAPRGALFFGRWLGPRLLENFGEVAMHPLELNVFSPASPPATETTEAPAVRAASPEVLVVAVPLLDAQGHAVGELLASVRRTIFDEARAARFWFIGLIVATGVVIGFLINYLLRRLLINRFEKLHREFAKVSAAGAAGRVQVHGSDEIAKLAADVNSMLEALATAELESRKLNDKLLESQKLESIGRLAGGIAHDFNNCLTSIFGSVDLCELDDANPAIRIHLERIRTSARHASGVVQQLMAFSQNRTPQLVPLGIDALFEETSALLKTFVPSTVKVTFVNAAAGGRVAGDPVQLQQVFVNLVRNAADAMKQAGAITITAAPTAEAKRLSIRIADTGPGIAPEVLPRMFDAFFTTKRQGQGYGLGLTVVKQIVENHRGGIAVSSAPGRGTVFEIELPSLGSPAPTEPAKGTATVYPAGAGGVADISRPREFVPAATSILVAEDDHGVRAFVEAVLRTDGFSVTVAPDGLTALNELEQRPRSYHLLLTDFSMPGMNGRDLGLRFKKLRPECPVILMSGFIDAQDAQELRDAGFHDVLQKPLTMPVLKRAVNTALRSGQ